MLNQVSNNADPIIQIICIFQKCNPHIPTSYQEGASAMSAMAKESLEFPFRLQRQKMAKKTNHSHRLLSRVRDLDRMLVFLTHYFMPSNSKKLYTQRDYGELSIYQPMLLYGIKIQGYEKASFPEWYQPRTWQWSSCHPGFIHAKTGYKFLSDN